METDEAGDYLHSDRERVCVAGIITAVTTKTTRNDQRMAFFTLEDRLGEIECIVFPKVLDDVGHHVRTDAVVRVDGTLSLREDEQPKVLVEGLTELKEDGAAAPAVQKTPAARPTTGQNGPVRIVYLRVPSLDDPKWHKAKNLLEIFDGECPVSVFAADRGAYFPQQTGFACSDFTLDQLRKLLGAENVVTK